MKLSNLVYAGVGYVLGARAGRERYEQIVRVSRRVAGSQTLQSTAGVVQAQLDQLAVAARQSLAAKIGSQPPPPYTANGVNGHNGHQRATR